MVNRIAICDDVEVERFVLKRQLMVYFQTNGREAQIQEYESGESLLADIEEGYIWPDLIFLDIYMGDLNGMDTARKLRDLGVKAPMLLSLPLSVLPLDIFSGKNLNKMTKLRRPFLKIHLTN